jgi:hypothetical protein
MCVSSWDVVWFYKYRENVFSCLRFKVSGFIPIAIGIRFKVQGSKFKVWALPMGALLQDGCGALRSGQIIPQGLGQP